MVVEIGDTAPGLLAASEMSADRKAAADIGGQFPMLAALSHSLTLILYLCSPRACLSHQQKLWFVVDVSIPVLCVGKENFPSEGEVQFLQSKHAMTSAKWRKSNPLKIL
jgi:hypothetical protein